MQERNHMPDTKNAKRRQGMQEPFRCTRSPKGADHPLPAHSRFVETYLYHHDRSFTGKEKDSESGFHYFGARYYDSEALTGWLSVDPMSDKYPSLSPYAYCAWNPIHYVDPNGMWHWTKGGCLESNMGDDVNTLNQFLGTAYADQIVSRCNIKFGTGLIIIPCQQLWVEIPCNNNDRTIENTLQAVTHYYWGGGETVNIGHTSTNEVIQLSSFREQLNDAFLSRTDEGKFGVDMTKSTFHIGHTNVAWEKGSTRNAMIITAKLYDNDGFWDPDFIDEMIGGKWLRIKHLQADGDGPNLERGGTPYHYDATTCVFFRQKQKEEL